MAKKGGSKHVCRFAAPRFWMQPPKQKHWAPRPSPGPHPIRRAIPMVILLRDMLKVVDLSVEAKKVLSLGRVLVNGKKIRDKNFPVGLFDIVEIPMLGKKWVIYPVPKYLLRPKEIKGEPVYLGRIERKMMVKGGKILLGLHNGHNIVLPVEEGRKYSRLDTVVYEGTKIKKHLPMKPGMLAIVSEGRRSGLVGKIIEIEPGSMIRKSHTKLDINGNVVEVPTEYVFVIGENEPEVKVA